MRTLSFIVRLLLLFGQLVVPARVTGVAAESIAAAATVDVFSANASTTYHNEKIIYFCIKIPTLLEHAPSGSLIALGEGRVGSCSDVARTDLVIRRSLDGGETWSPLEVLFSNSSSDEGSSNVIGNAAPVVDRSTGRVWLPFNRNNQETWLSYSDDGGASWAVPTLMPHLQQASWKWVGVGPPGGVQLRSGRLLVPGYHSEVWPHPNRSSIGSGLTKGHAIVSDDNGESWRLAADNFGYRQDSNEGETNRDKGGSAGLDGNVSAVQRFYINEQQAAQLPDGRVVMNSRTLADKRAISFSEDEGESFSPPVFAEGLFETYQGCEGSTVFHAASGLLVYSGVQGSPPLRLYRQDLALFNSSDGGLTWRRAATISAGASGYSALAATQDGGISILFERSDCQGKGPIGCPLVFLPQHITFQKLF